MNENQIELRNLVNAKLAAHTKDVLTEGEIDGFINICRPIVSGNLTDEEVEDVRRQIHAENSIRFVRGTAIYEEGHKKWLEQRKPSLDLAYWHRFEQFLLNDKGFTAKMSKSMDVVTDDIVDLLGDPFNVNLVQRRGLVIGDVQSGKTLTYSGVINKAIDVGYKVIILLAGTSNELREQTQKRISEAVIGYPPIDGAEKGIIGVGRYNPGLHPSSATSYKRDFRKDSMDFNMSLPTSGGGDRAMIFVVKKNVTVLKNLYDWIVANNCLEGQKKIDNALLLIDDEADYASINTSADKDNLTRTNEAIVKLLNIFRFASYVGFTATPFANVFIEPATEEEMLNDRINIFPKDYIYALEPPSNYIGARDIFGQRAKYASIIRVIDDGEEYYPLKHEKNSDFSHISPSLKRAINTFLLGNVIRDIRHQVKTPRSMMVNVSRFVMTSRDLRRAIDDYLCEIKNSIKIYSQLSPDEALLDDNLMYLSRVFDEEYGGTVYSWANDIQPRLMESIMPILVKSVDGGNKLNYDDYSTPLRAILVGGIVMSRGLTLEGLMVSYLYRNTKMYDTLMQMGRWFGYRDGYSDLCRVYLDPESECWYSHISDAADELRYDVKMMRDRGATPKDFGMKVRTNPELPLLITARNKMRSATQRQITTSFSGEVIEAKWLTSNVDDNEHNKTCVISFLKNIDLRKVASGKSYGANDVSIERILNLLANIRVPGVNQNFEPELLHRFIRSYNGTELKTWDVYIPSGEGSSYLLSDGCEIKSISRSKAFLSGNGEVVGLNKSRLGSVSDVCFGISADEVKRVKDDYALIHGGKSAPGKAFFTYDGVKRRPLLIIYFVEPLLSDNKHGALNIDGPIVSFAMGFPLLANAETNTITYFVNQRFEQNSESFLGEIDEDEEQEQGE